MRFQVQKLEKYLKSKNDHEKPLGALNQFGMDGLVGGWGSKGSFDFLFFQVCKQARCINTINGV